MITRKGIESYFDEEALSEKVRYDKLMSEELSERIRKRKAIAGLRLVRIGKRESPEQHDLLRLSYTKNLSDFKEGDRLILHEEKDTMNNLECTLYAYNEDESLTISVFPPDMSQYKDGYWANKDLVLDKARVDLRQYVYRPFCFSLPYDQRFWREHIVNSPLKPQIENYAESVEELDDTIRNMEFSFTDKQREAILNSMAAKDYYLIQGPPGTGKSFVLSIIIAEELVYFRHKVIVIGPNHMAINNLLGQILKLSPSITRAYCYKVGPVYHAPTFEVEMEEGKVGIDNASYLNVANIMSSENALLFGLTPHSLYTRRASGLECDTLIVDEAGQMTIPLALMGMIKAKKHIFAGDHKQLPPIITSDKIPDELKVSIFKKLLREDNCTMLDKTFRMCKSICDFVSELFYDGKLSAVVENGSGKVVCKDKLYSFTSPVVLYNVEDDGLQVSEREAEEIVKMIKRFLSLGVSAEDIGVLSPFRAQAAHIRRLVKHDDRIQEEDYKALAVDTIDKMQGQERDIIIFSMVSGDLEYMNEMGEFLYNPNKLNVAFSRAKSKLIIVGNIEKLRLLDKAQFPHVRKMLEYKNSVILNTKGHKEG